MTHLLPIKAEQHLLLYTTQGVGFLAPTDAVMTRQKAGKQLINLDAGAKLAEPVWLDNLDDYLVLVSSEGRMLIYRLSELPVLAKGKGNKLMSLKADERIVFTAFFKPGMAYKLHAGKRYLSLKPADWQAYVGTRAKRGVALPKGFTQIADVEELGLISALEKAVEMPKTGSLFD
jgi:topoisomerase-4 subunit A